MELLFLDEEYFKKQSLKHYKDLIGKCLKVVHRGSRSTYLDKEGKNVHRVDQAYITYIFDIESYSSEAWRYIEYLNGITVSIEFWGTEIDDEDLTISTSDCVVLDFQNEGEFEKEEHYLIEKEDAVKEIENYFYHSVLHDIK